MILQKFWTISNNDDYGLRTNYFLHTLWNQFIAAFWKSSTGPPKLMIACNLWTAFKRLPDERDLAPHNRRMLLEAKRSGWNVFYGKVMLKAQSSKLSFGFRCSFMLDTNKLSNPSGQFSVYNWGRRNRSLLDPVLPEHVNFSGI
jgi:hypothetical protein